MSETAEAFLRYIRPHWHPLNSVARRYTVEVEGARDLVQETLLHAWRAFSPTEQGAYKGSWLFVIMRNVALDWQRKAQRRIKLCLSSQSELTEISPADPTEPFAPLPAMDEQRFREFLDDRVAAALDALDAPFREVIVLSVAGDLTYREVAAVLDCPVGTVMSRMARARRALRERLSQFARATGHLKESRP